MLIYLPAPPKLVWVHGEHDGVESLESHWHNSKNIQFVRSLDEYGEAQLEIEVTSPFYRIKDRRTGKIAIEWIRSLANSSQSVIEMLGKMVNWERTISLQNENSVIKTWFNFEIDLVKDPRYPFLTISESETIIEVNSTNFIE